MAAAAVDWLVVVAIHLPLLGYGLLKVGSVAPIIHITNSLSLPRWIIYLFASLVESIRRSDDHDLD